jgi:hypothetical protein
MNQIKNGDIVMHRSGGNAPYITIGRVISGAETCSHLRIMEIVRVFGFGSDHEHYAHTDKSESNVYLASECSFLWEDNRIPRLTDEERANYAKSVGDAAIQAGRKAQDAKNRGAM